MCLTEEIFEEEVQDIQNSEITVEANPSVIEEYDISISIQVYPVKSEEEKKVTKKIERICRIFQGIIISKSTNIFIKGSFGTNPFHCYSMARAISYCVSIEGGSDSFAIIKFYRRNYLSGETTFIYEDYVTPGYTIDTLKLERFIKENH